VTIQKNSSGEVIFSGIIQKISDGKKGEQKVYSIGTDKDSKKGIKIILDSTMTIKITRSLEKKKNVKCEEEESEHKPRQIDNQGR
jgi:hypothetical protein